MNVTTKSPTEKAVIIGTEAYHSEAYAREENEKLWGKVWQVACRVEEIPKVGDYVTYDILEESIIVVRVTPDRIAAYYNVCQHRGRRLTKGCGHAKGFVCGFHAWKWNLEGENIDALCRDEWGGALTDENLRLPQVKLDTWGGYVFINMDPNCESLHSYLEPAVSVLNPFQLEKMRYAWRKWLYFPCNWKTALEAFMEGYHVLGTHPQLTRWGGAGLTWSKEYGRHGAFGAKTTGGFGGSTSKVFTSDVRKALAESLTEMWAELRASTTQTIVDVANRLVDELPENTPSDQVMRHLMTRAMEIDAARGVIWPKVDPKTLTDAGNGWNIFPNTNILPGLTTALCYRARPHGYDPDSCIFEVYVLERFPEGQEPKTENIYEPEMTREKWLQVLMQDFGNMQEVHAGMKSRGFRGCRPNPIQERIVINFHETLAKYMGRGAPKPIK
ncbi:MAG: aromatic ring-hydroxylating dioxygenase subunit alpha [Rhodospirillaceae bacterium]|nr:MAG: aromatic ring-hydroxylating dioxygenase subunit alpha [Rhodospirillaceae bacterium]